ncbi:hypothetical protein KMAL_26860 [Novacetimonas maltaceti]|uniref:Uncharacterized protein n=1 Tax=Novacetimonas maltaceti TaxID=1203393 RepID=A0A2S3VYH7_9PROT|nr:hypothetical protein KMAL_26860 [Novacetimonas maltaceti]
MPAMMARQDAARAVFHQPRGAVGALHPVPAGAAQRQWRIAPAVEEQHRLFLPPDRVLDRADQHGREEQPAFGRVGAHVECAHLRHGRIAMPRPQPQVAVTPRADIGQCLKAWRGGNQDDGGGVHARAHHGHVARVVGHAFLLLEGGFVFLIDDDEAKA